MENLASANLPGPSPSLNFPPMYQQIQADFEALVPLSSQELAVIPKYFRPLSLKRKQFLLEAGSVCTFIAYLNRGCIRHFHLRDGDEITCDISLEGSFITEFGSFNQGNSSNISFQTMEESELLLIQREDLFQIYAQFPAFERIGRKITEQVVLRTTEIAMSLASDKPETRYQKLLQTSPHIFQRVSQRHIANLLGITPESLSRIRKRISAGSKS